MWILAKARSNKRPKQTRTGSQKHPDTHTEQSTWRRKSGRGRHWYQPVILRARLDGPASS